MNEAVPLPLWERCREAVLLSAEWSRDPAAPQYVASYDSLTELTGRAARRRRGLLRQFEAAGPWHFDPIGEGNIDAAFGLERLWQRDGPEEAAFVRSCFRRLTELKLSGGLLWSREEAVGYSIAAPWNETGAVLLALRTKALPAGASAMLYYQTAVRLGEKMPRLVWINLGRGGGAQEQQNRLSYHPRIISP